MRAVEVPQHIRAMVNIKITQCLDLAEKHYGRKFARPNVDYKVTGRVAGYAFYKDNRVSFNSVLLMENIDEFIADTVPHECAHLITEVVYPEAHRPSRASYSSRPSKRQPHGPCWQEVMRVLGVEPKRTHNYDTTNSRRQKAGSETVECTCCGTKYTIGKARVQTLKHDPTALWCPKCGKVRGRVQFVNAEPAPVVQSPVKSVQKSKYTICQEIYISNKYSATSKQLLEMFIAQAGCTKAGAQTYLSKLRNK